MAQNNDKLKKTAPKSREDTPEKLVDMIINGFKQLEKDIKSKPKS